VSPSASNVTGCATHLGANAGSTLADDAVGRQFLPCEAVDQPVGVHRQLDVVPLCPRMDSTNTATFGRVCATDTGATCPAPASVA
jgi:hypothetical protein